MICQCVAVYCGSKRGVFEDTKNNKSINYQHLKIQPLDDDSNGFDDMILSVPYDYDLSNLQKLHTYVFNIVLPKFQRTDSKFRCIGVLPFDSK